MNTSVVQAKLISIQVGALQTIGRHEATNSMDQVWTTGFFKNPVSGLVSLGSTNLQGDQQADLKNHGGPEKAVNVYPAEHYSYWEQDLGVAKFPCGAFGENFTIQGLLEPDVCIGDVFEIGDALVQVSQPRQPCWKLARRWRMNDLALRVQQTGRTGWYFRVLRQGLVQAGTTLLLRERPCPEWTVAAANEVMHHRLQERAAARELSACPFLSKRWRETLAKREVTGMVGSRDARLYGPNKSSHENVNRLADSRPPQGGSD